MIARLKHSKMWMLLSNNIHVWLCEGKLIYWQFILDRILQHYDSNVEEKNVYADIKTVIVMVDGFAGGQGGLTDRLRGALSVYSLCKRKNWNFKFYFDYPFDLHDYLLPNKYDWTISKKNISRNTNSAKPMALYLMNVFFEDWLDKHILVREITNSCFYQYQIYTNAFFDKKQYPRLFNELFKPSPLLQHEINSNKEQIKSKYISASFRFQELLGDLKEANECIVLPEEKQMILIKKCMDELRHFISAIPENYKILVTSDSVKFLSYAKELERVYVIPGKIFHPQHMAAGTTPFIKSFVDFYMLMEAEEVYLFKTGLMYKSGFPEFAALLGGKKFYYKEF